MTAYVPRLLVMEARVCFPACPAFDTDEECSGTMSLLLDQQHGLARREPMTDHTKPRAGETGNLGVIRITIEEARVLAQLQHSGSSGRGVPEWR